MAMEVHDDRNDCYVGGGFRLNRVEHITLAEFCLEISTASIHGDCDSSFVQQIVVWLKKLNV